MISYISKKTGEVLICIILFIFYSYGSKVHGSLGIISQSSGDSVYVNGNFVGVVPIEKKIVLPCGIAKILVGNTEKRVTIQPNRVSYIDMDTKGKEVKKVSRFGLILGVSLSVLCGFSLLILGALSDAMKGH